MFVLTQLTSYGASANQIVSAPWNSADKGASLTLSSSDFNVTQGTSGAYDFVRCKIARSSGRYYFEIVDIAVAAVDGIKGFCDAGPINPNYHYHTVYGAGVRRAGGSAVNEVRGWTQDYSTAPAGSAADNDVWTFAIDFVSGKAWVGLNGTWYNSGDPAAGTGQWLSGIAQPVYPAASLYTINNQLQLVTAAGGFSHTVPTGFKPWNVN